MKMIKGLKKAVGDFKRYNAGGPYSDRYGILYFNISEREVFANEYIGFGRGNSIWPNDNISLISKMMKEENPYLEESKITMSEVKNFIEKHFPEN